jgi:hypothetical protein
VIATNLQHTGHRSDLVQTPRTGHSRPMLWRRDAGWVGDDVRAVRATVSAWDGLLGHTGPTAVIRAERAGDLQLPDPVAVSAA